MKDKLIPHSKFPWFLGGSALLIALCAACFSVYGIAMLFAGASISVMIMASSLEIGKLMATTFLYRYWHKCKNLLRWYLIVSVFILMLITSLGIFGYLSAAYQKSSIEFGITQEKIVNVETQKEFYLTKIDDSKKRITELTKLRVGQEERMSGILTNEMITRNPIQLKQLQEQTISLINSTDSSITEENTKIQKSNDEIQTLNDEINSLKLLTAEKKDVQTFKFVADALGISLDTVARWFILGIIFVFDPLAICLVLAYNVSVYKKVDDSVYEEPPSTKPTINKTVETPVVDIPTIEVEEPIVENSPIEEPPTTQETTPTVVSQPTQVVEPVKDEFYNQYFKHST